MQAIASSAPAVPQVANKKAGGGGGGGGEDGPSRHSTPPSSDAHKRVESQLGGILGGSSDHIPQANKKSVQELLNMMATGRMVEVNEYLNSLSKEDREDARAQLKQLMESAAAMF